MITAQDDLSQDQTEIFYRFSQLTGKFYEESRPVVEVDINAGKPACISAISEHSINSRGFHDQYLGEQLHIYPLYTELRPYEDQRKQSSSFAVSTDRPTRGKITNVTSSSANRLKKRICRAGVFDGWLDLTFADDVMIDKTITNRAEFSYYCLKRLMLYARKHYGLYLVWKRENQDRKSGVIGGDIVPHFHVLFGGLSSHQNLEAICCDLLIEWLRLTGTSDPNAFKVAFARDKRTGAPKSYRKVENQKHAMCYVGKYFSKTDALEIPEGESIGRCWGCSKNCPDYKPIIVDLTKKESAFYRRVMMRMKKITRFCITKGGKKIDYGLTCRSIYKQLSIGLPTFLFVDKTDIIRLIEHSFEGFQGLSDIPCVNINVAISF